MPVTVVCAVLLLKSGQNAKIKGDASVAMISVGALAIGYLLMNLFPTSSNVSADVCSTLFGSTSILTLTGTEVWLCVGLSVAVVLLILSLFCVLPLACSRSTGYTLTEQTFFLVMTNIQYYPEQYIGQKNEYDCFSYELTDIDGKKYYCGVRKCSAGYGCKCGKDTVIGFLLEYDDEIPAPRNQSEDTNDKTWIKLSGKLKSAEKKEIRIFAYSDNEIDRSTVESIYFLTFTVESLDLIENYNDLNYYVTK